MATLIAVGLSLAVTLLAGGPGAVPVAASSLGTAPAMVERAVGPTPPRPNDAASSTATATAAATAVHWQVPVSAPVADPFRPPAGPYGPGNRGIEYRTAPGDRVVAVADGVVTFAGQVGGRLFVVVTHPNPGGGPAIRSTYAYLLTIAVATGDRVAAGAMVAEADAGFHLTARVGSRYVDPALFLAPPPLSVRLVPDRGR